MESTSAAAVRRQKGIDKAILSRIQHLDVTANLTDKSHETVGHGGYSEVFTGRLHRVGNGQVDVAIKRLRFHTGEEKVLKARPSSLIVEELARLTRTV